MSEEKNNQVNEENKDVGGVLLNSSGQVIYDLFVEYRDGSAFKKYSDNPNIQNPPEIIDDMKATLNNVFDIEERKEEIEEIKEGAVVKKTVINKTADDLDYRSNEGVGNTGNKLLDEFSINDVDVFLSNSLKEKENRKELDTNLFIPQELNPVGFGNYAMLFMRGIQYTDKNDGDKRKTEFVPSRRLEAGLNECVFTLLSRVGKGENVAQVKNRLERENVSNGGYSKEDLPVLRNAYGTREMITTFGNIMAKNLGLKKKSNLTRKQEIEAEVIKTSLGNCAFNLMLHKGILNRLNEKPHPYALRAYNLLIRSGIEKPSKSLLDSDKEETIEQKRIKQKYATVTKKFPKIGENLFEVAPEVMKAFRSNADNVKQCFDLLHRFEREQDVQERYFGKKPRKIKMREKKLNGVTKLSKADEKYCENIAKTEYHLDKDAMEYFKKLIKESGPMRLILRRGGYNISAEQFNNTIGNKDIQSREALEKFYKDTYDEKNGGNVEGHKFEDLSFAKKQSIVDKNNKYLLSMRQLDEFYKKYKTKRFMLPLNMQKTTRIGYDNPILDVQQDKFIRGMINVGSDEDNYIGEKDGVAFAKAIGFALGIDYEKRSTRSFLKSFNDEFRKVLNTQENGRFINFVKEVGKDGKETKVLEKHKVEDLILFDEKSGNAKINMKYIGSDDFKKVLNRLDKVILGSWENPKYALEIEHLGFAIKNVSALQRLHKDINADMKKDKMNNIDVDAEDYFKNKKYLSLFNIEIDGKTNGQAIKLASMPYFKKEKEDEKGEQYEKDKATYRELFNKIGLMQKGEYNSLGEYIEQGNKDLYTTVADNFLNIISDDKQMQKNMETIFGKVDDRDLFKKITMVNGYGATMGMSVAFMNTLDEKYEEHMAKLVGQMNRGEIEIDKAIEEGIKNTKAYCELREVSNKKEDVEEKCFSMLGIRKGKEEGKYDILVSDTEVETYSYDAQNPKAFLDICKTRKRDIGNEFIIQSDVEFKDVRETDITKLKVKQCVDEALSETIPYSRGMLEHILGVSQLHYSVFEDSYNKFKKNELSEVVADIIKIDDGSDATKELKKNISDEELEKFRINCGVNTYTNGGNIIAVGENKWENVVDAEGNAVHTMDSFGDTLFGTYIDSHTDVYEKSIHGDVGASMMVLMIHPIEATIMKKTIGEDCVAGQAFQINDAMVCNAVNAEEMARRYNEVFMENVGVNAKSPLEMYVDGFRKAFNSMKEHDERYDDSEKNEVLKYWDSDKGVFDSKALKALEEANEKETNKSKKIKNEQLLDKMDKFNSLVEAVDVIKENKIELYKNIGCIDQMTGMIKCSPYVEGNEIEQSKNKAIEAVQTMEVIEVAKPRRGRPRKNQSTER